MCSSDLSQGQNLPSMEMSPLNFAALVVSSASDPSFFYKTIGIFVADECSPRFNQTNKEGLPWVGFKNMEQISDKPTELNFENMMKLKRDYPDHIMVASIMGSNEKEWRDLATMCDQAGVDLIEGNFSCPQMTSHDMGSDVGTTH